MENTDLTKQNKNYIYVVLGTVFVLLIPLIAMQFNDSVDWNVFDFGLIGTLLLATGFTFVFVSQKLGSIRYKIILGVFLLALLALVWAELAVGVFGSPFAGS